MKEDKPQREDKEKKEEKKEKILTLYDLHNFLSCLVEDSLPFSVGQVPGGVNTATKGGVKPKKSTVAGTNVSARRISKWFLIDFRSKNEIAVAKQG